MGQAKDKIPVGVLFSTTGPYASLGREGFDGAMAAIDEINKTDAYAFELFAEIGDPGGNTEAYAELGRRIIKTSNARFVVGCTTSWSRKEIIPVLEKTGTHLWYPCPYEGFEGNDHVVYIGACPNQHIVPLLSYIVPRFGPNPILVGSNYIWGWETNRIAREYVERAGGTVRGERFVPLGDRGIAHIIEEIRQKRPDFILNTLIGPSSEAFVEAYYALGQSDPAFSPDEHPIISCNWTENEIATLGEKAAGHFTIAPYFQALPTADNKAFLDVVTKFAPGTQHISAFFAQAYAAVHMIARGIAATGKIDAEAVLSHAKTSTYQAPFGSARIHPETNHTVMVPRIGRANADGRFEIVTEAGAPIIPDPYLARRELNPMADFSNSDGQSTSHLRLVK